MDVPMAIFAQSKTVVIAEDDDFLRGLINEFLSSHGYRVAAYSGGEEAVSAARKLHADVLITDILMEEGEGISTIMNMRKAEKNIGIIAMSSNAQYLAYAGKIGADCVMQKPLRCRALLNAVRSLQGRACQHTEVACT
jgi:DNA-binding response OmpR family regulator